MIKIADTSFKHEKVPEGFQKVSFDANSLITTNVPLETTVDIILRRIYINHELTSLTKKEMKELLLL